MGSGTVGKWIAKKMEEDEKKAAFDSTVSFRRSLAIYIR